MQKYSVLTNPAAYMGTITGCFLLPVNSYVCIREEEHVFRESFVCHEIASNMLTMFLLYCEYEQYKQAFLWADTDIHTTCVHIHKCVYM